jgi:VWFA-related protein
MRIRALHLGAALTFCLVSGTGSTQTPQKENANTLRVTSRLVSLEVLVTDKRTGARVDLLKQEDFKVLDEGRPQTLTHFKSAADRERPLAITLIINRFNCTRKNVPILHEALARALHQLQSQDEVAVLSYWYECELIQELTRDRGRVLAALEKVAAQQEEAYRQKAYKEYRKKRAVDDYHTAFENSIRTGMGRARELYPQARPALIFIDDDLSTLMKDALKKLTFELLDADAVVGGLIKAEGATGSMRAMSGIINTLPYATFRTKVIEYLSGQTGGEIVNVQGDNYSDALERVIGNIVGCYSLGFEPDEARLDGRFHEIKVQVRVPPELGKGRKVAVRVRRGYVATKEPLP